MGGLSVLSATSTSPPAECLPPQVAKVYYEPKTPVSPTPLSPSPTHSSDDSGSEDWVSSQMVDLAGPDFKG